MVHPGQQPVLTAGSSHPYTAGSSHPSTLRPYTHTHTHTHTHRHRHARAHKHTRTHARTYAHTHTNTCTHTYTHVHIQHLSTYNTVHTHSTHTQYTHTRMHDPGPAAAAAPAAGLEDTYPTFAQLVYNLTYLIPTRAQCHLSNCTLHLNPTQHPNNSVPRPSISRVVC